MAVDIQQTAAFVAAAVVVLAILGVGVSQLLKLLGKRQQENVEDLVESLGVVKTKEWRDKIDKVLDGLADEANDQTKDLMRHRLELITQLSSVMGALRDQDKMLLTLMKRTEGLEAAMQRNDDIQKSVALILEHHRK